METATTKDLILEIGTEEIPAGYFQHILDMLSGEKDSLVLELFKAKNINADNIRSYSTPRRVILHIMNIAAYQDITIDGPPVRLAFDTHKNPTRALESFLQNNNASLTDIEIIKGDREERVRLVKKNVSNKEILEALLPDVIKQLDFPKTMRWDKSGVVFARPIRWILALMGNEVLRFSYGRLASSNITSGHRFLGKKNIKVKNTSVFFKLLTKNRVVWNNCERRQRTEAFLQKRNWYENKTLLEEVCNIIECPFFIEGIFKKEYLLLPKEVLLASMSKHQRIFCLKDKKGELTNRFIAVLNGKYGGLREIRSHYEEVLDARLKDAMFFYNTDIKKSIGEWAEGLEGIIFHKQLGTLKDKVSRIKEASFFLAKGMVLEENEKKDLTRAVYLCKADLLTNMVREFPSLQGIMGGYYAKASGEKQEVCQAIGEHYLPRFAEDTLPDTKLGIICSLADKLDNIMCYFKIGKFPKGNWDIYALRRQGIAIISILLKRKVSVSLESLFEHLYDVAPGDYDKEKLRLIFLDFFKERFISFVKERFRYQYDLLDSVVSPGVDDMFIASLKLESLNSIIEKSSFKNARCIVERATNILKASKDRDVPLQPKSSSLREQEEIALYNRFSEIKERFLILCQENRYNEATQLYADSLYDDIHKFFEKVMVNVEEKALRLNRLALLYAINSLYAANLADLSKMVAGK